MASCVVDDLASWAFDSSYLVGESVRLVACDEDAFQVVHVVVHVAVHEVHEGDRGVLDVLAVHQETDDEASFHFDVKVTSRESFDSFDCVLVVKREEAVGLDWERLVADVARFLAEDIEASYEVGEEMEHLTEDHRVAKVLLEAFAVDLDD